MFWGLTPALDFQEKLLPKSDSKELNILIIGGGDARHVLKTIARKYRHEKVKIKFFVMEGCMETVARQLLLLLIAFMPRKELGEVRKTRTFMELYGNTLVRPHVAKFLTSTSTELLKMITDYEYMKTTTSFIKLDVQYKERDYLENLIKFWSSCDNFDIYDSWDRRVRKMLGMRYDAKLGAFDWDLHMRYHAVGGNLVGSQEYKSFRSKGVSFMWLESEVSKPNRSLVCATIPNGEKFIHYGYLGDIQTGPFVSYGLECEDEEFLKSTNGHNKFRATDVTERNLRQIFHEIEFESPYEHQSFNDYLLGAVRMQEDDPIVDITSESVVSRLRKYESIQINDVDIRFLSISHLKKMKHRDDFKEMFDLVYFNSTHLSYLDPDVVKKIAGKNCVLLVENQRFVLSHRDKNLNEFAETVEGMIKGIDGAQVSNFDPINNNYFEYILNVK